MNRIGTGIDKEIENTATWMASERFREHTRLFSARQVVEQRGTIAADYTVARHSAEAFFARLRELFAAREAITTFGPYSPGQAVVMKRLGIEGIYLGGWATSAKGSLTEDPGADLASYPLSQVPDEAAPIVRALLAADKNQQFARMQMSKADRAASPPINYSPYIIADADTGHGGEAHVRNLVRRFVEVGVPGYHIEDQKPGVKKCGHQGGKVLVPVHEQIQRLNAARLQLDVMGVPGIIVARTDAEAATFLDGRDDERDQPFLLGATRVDLPSYKVAALALLRRFYELGAKDLNGHMLHQVSEAAYERAYDWMRRTGLMATIEQAAKQIEGSNVSSVPLVLDQVSDSFLEVWQAEAGLRTYPQAVADAMAFHRDEGVKFDMDEDEWLAWATTASFKETREKARSMGAHVVWDCELSRTPEGYYPIQGGIPYATARSLAVAPFCDLLWMETKTAHLGDAKIFSEAVHAQYPEKMLAYNLSPSFNWDTTGMTEEQMSAFPAELGKLGFVFNFITYGGHQVDGAAAEEFATALLQDGMLSLARLQRRIRLLDSPYRTPQTHVGGPRLDGALMAASGRTASTRAMGKGSTQVQHLAQVEIPASLLEAWLEQWGKAHDVPGRLRVRLRPHRAGSDLLALRVIDQDKSDVARVVFANILDRSRRSILSIRDQTTQDESLRRKRLMTLIHLFLIHRYKIKSVHYVSPTDDNLKQTEGMRKIGLYSEVKTEVGDIIVATVNPDRVAALLGADEAELTKLIWKSA